MQTLADLSAEFGFGPRDWRGMDVFEFRGWVAELTRRRVEAQKAHARAEREAEMRRMRNG